jgi:hypothetical protein
MIFMSQSGLMHPERETEWAAWYVEHLQTMQTVSGIESAVRFTTQSADWPPSLAMYSIRDAKVFQDPYYLKIRGMGPWAEQIDKRFYQRNLFEVVDKRSLQTAPLVPVDHVLIVTNQTQPELKIAALDFLWLKTVGLDRSTPYRGIAVISKRHASTLGHDAGVAIYIPQ